MTDQSHQSHVRTDRFLWAVRLYKTRSESTQACKGGKVKVNGRTAKPATPVRIGDRVETLLNGWKREIVIEQLIEKRVGATIAATCYVDHSPPKPESAPFNMPFGVRDRGSGRPTKKERRELERLRGTRK